MHLITKEINSISIPDKNLPSGAIILQAHLQLLFLLHVSHSFVLSVHLFHYYTIEVIHRFHQSPKMLSITCMPLKCTNTYGTYNFSLQ